MLDALPHELYVLDEHLEVQWVNERALDRCSTKSAFKRRKAYCYREIFDRRERCDNCPAVKTFESGKIETVVIRIPAGDEHRHFLATAAPLGRHLTDDARLVVEMVQGSTALQPDPTLADLNGFDPTTSGVPVPAPGNWNEEALGSSNLPSSAPGALGTSSLPVYTGQDYSLSQLTVALPNTDTSTTDGYAGMYVLRLQTFQHNDGGTTTSYDSADISVNSSTGAWTLVYSPQAATTTTLDTPTPSSPQPFGTSVTLKATVADASAPGTVQFESGGSPVGGAAGHQWDGHVDHHGLADRNRFPQRGLYADDGGGVRRIDQ